MIDPGLLPKDGKKFSLNDAEIHYYESFFSTIEAETLFKQLLNETSWQQDPITVFGKTYPQPRLTALYANNSKPYSYSGITMQPKMMTPLLKEIQTKIARVCDVEFTTVLLNLYRDGKDSNGWHADNEKALGKSPKIASISLGEERFFHLKHRKIKTLRLKIKLHSGSLLLMEGDTQEQWLHQIPKTAKPLTARINLTFRKII